MSATDERARRRVLHRRAVVLEWFTVGWNVVEALVAVAAGLLSGSVALSSTALTLLVLPVLHSLVEPWAKRRGR